MPPSERSPLLNGNHRRSLSERLISAIKAEDEPSWSKSIRFFLFGSWLHVFLAFVPLSVVAHKLHWDAALRFSFSFIAILPLAKLLGDATEQLSLPLGDTLSGLLNATFGNAVEIIVGVAALLQGEIRIVQTSMLGSILSNLLLVLGCSFVAGHYAQLESNFQVTGAQTSSSLLTLACITLVIPAAYQTTRELPFNSTTQLSPPSPEDVQSGVLIISRGTSILLLLVYVAYLYFQLFSHAHLFKDPREGEIDEVQKMNTASAGLCLLLVTITTSFCADYLVASIEETAERYHIPKPFIGIILIPIVANAAEHTTSVWMAMKDKMELTIQICVGSSIQIATFVIPLLVIVGWITGHELTLHFANFETVVLFVSVLLVNMLIMDGKSNYMEGLMLITLYFVIGLVFWNF